MSAIARWAGGCWVAAGVLILAELAHPDILAIGFAAGARDVAWPAVHVAWLLVALLTMFGLAGLGVGYGPALGRLGAIGMVLAGVGLVVAAGIFLAEGLIFPVLAREAPRLLAFSGPLGSSRPLWAAGAIAGLWFAGLALVGIAVERAHVLWRRAGTLLAVATALFVLFAGPFVPVLGPVAVLLLSAALVRFGLAVWFAGSADRGGAMATMSAGERTPR